MRESISYNTDIMADALELAATMELSANLLKQLFHWWQVGIASLHFC
jgi:hypothetical protein